MEKRFGNADYFKTEDFKSKAKQTKLAKYGRDDIGQFGSPEHKKALLDKYGVAEAMRSPEVKEKLNRTMLERYGVNRYAKTLDFHKKARKLYIVSSGETFDSS